MFRNTILNRTLAIILFTLMLSSALTAVVFTYSGGQVFSGIKARELEPRALHIARVTGEYMQGMISMGEYERAIGRSNEIWDAAIYAFNAQGRLFVYSSMEDDSVNIDAVAQYLGRVLEGKSVYSPNTKNSAGVIIGEPVIGYNGEIIGAVFLVKPLNEVRAALHGLMIALIITMLTVFAAMIIPAYFVSRRITEPIRQMNLAANAMANGDFSAEADIRGTEETVQLGQSLNHLSKALHTTISDLTLEKNRLHAVINGHGDGIAAMDAEGCIIKINSAAVKLMGGSEGEDITLLNSYRESLVDVNRALSGEVRSKEIKVRDRTLKITMTPLTVEGKSGGAVMLIRDITEASRLEQTRKDYVANVSHELRTPIASIRGLAEALNDGLVKKDEDKARYYGYILRESMRLSRLIDDLLELSRLQSGAVALTKRYIMADELIYDVADRFSTDAAQKGLKIKAGCENAGRVYTNPDRAEQVLVALMDNAVKHGEAGGTVEISAEKDGDRLKMTVSNPGKIADEDIDHVFERFYKGDKSHSGAGTGLGLSIVKELLNLMGEEISVSSEGGRVSFTFTLSIERDLEKCVKSPAV